MPFLERLRGRAPETILGVVLVGVICNFSYDMVLKPGVMVGGGKLLTLATLGSSRIRDAAYEAAAFDPRPVTPLLIVLPASSVPVGGLLALALFAVWRKRSKLVRLLSERKASADPSRHKEIDAELEKGLTTIRRRLTIPSLLVIVPSVVALQVALAIHNQSILVWRVFHNDLAILRPTIGAFKCDELASSFASMKTRNDFLTIRASMEELARSNKKTLNDIETW